MTTRMHGAWTLQTHSTTGSQLEYLTKVGRSGKSFSEEKDVRYSNYMPH